MTRSASETIGALRGTIGRERALAELVQALYFDVRSRNAAAVGAVHVTCADEAEAECAEAFQHGFVQYLLPPLKFARRSAFRVSNLGGRYEWGVIREADRHFAPAGGAGRAERLMVVKINAHVACAEVPAGEDGLHLDGARAVQFGLQRRYGQECPCCSALYDVLHGGTEPWIAELRELFGSEGRDRLAALADPARVDPACAPLFAAMVSARLQARTATIDIQDLKPAAPVRYLVLPCVTINRAERDTELLCGIYAVDATGPDDVAVTYAGLGDDPAQYRVHVRNRLLHVSDSESGVPRPGRDHRSAVRAIWESHHRGRTLPHDDPRLARIREDVARNRHRDHHHARMLLRAALPVLAEVMPVSAAVLLFAEGAAGIHHAYRVHRLARDLEGSDEARTILAEVHDRVDRLPPDHAEALIELLVREYGR